jgi:plasmid stability protein
MQSMSALNLTVRNLPEEVSAALEREKRRRGTSLNQTVIDLLRQSLGVPGTRNNGLARLAGTWTEADQQEFLSSIHSLNEIDPDLWK